MITQEKLKEALLYKPETGEFTWLKRPISHFNSNRGHSVYNSMYAGKPAGCVSASDGYVIITINGSPYKAHRLAWLYVYGEFPVNQSDHKNHKRADNRIANIRDVPPAVNMKNQTLRSTNKSGQAGVHWRKDKKKYRAEIGVKSKSKHLGYYSEYTHAVIMRKFAENLYGYHKNHGLQA